MSSSGQRYPGCVNPFVIRRTAIDTFTGEVTFNEFEKRCGNRRAGVCQGCSEMWRDDAFFALLKGAQLHNGNVTFITFTADGAKTFGATHTAQRSGQISERCACRKLKSKIQFNSKDKIVDDFNVNCLRSIRKLRVGGPNFQICKSC